MRLAPVVLALSFLVTGCKGMGGLASGLGHVAGGMAKVASGVGHIASGVGKVAGPALSGVGKVAASTGRVVATVGRVTGSTLARATPAIVRTTATVARATLPIAEDIAEAAALSSTPDPDDPTEQPEHTPVDGPLIDNHDPCNSCPDDLSCDQCLGRGDVACRWTPPGAYTRCESSQ